MIPEEVTPLFEIIYPDNRVVLDYGDMRDLVLIALIDTATGADVDPAALAWPGPRAETVSFTDFGALLDHISSAGESDCEGYVARFAAHQARPHIRFELKFPAYVAAHRVVFGLTSVRVWEAAAVSAAARTGASAKAMAARLGLSPDTVAGLLGHGEDPVEGLRATLPEEFLPWYDAAVAEVTAEASKRMRLYESLAREAAMDADDDSDRAFAAAAQRLAARTTTYIQARSSLSAGGEPMRASPSGPTRSRAGPATVRQSAAPATGRTTSTPPSGRSLRRTVDLSILSATPCLGVDTTQR